MLNNLQTHLQTHQAHFQADLQPRLQTTDLSLSIGTRRLLTNLTWQVNAGECWVVIGRNGVGKTTLLRNLAGIVNVSADSDDVLINEQPLHKWPLSELAKIRAYLPQELNDAFSYQVIETVLGARHPYSDGHYWESAEDLALAHAALSELDVLELAKRDVRSLSGGERQRVAIAAVLAQDTQLMILDEPTKSLDLGHQISVMHIFANRCKVENKAIVMVSHDLNVAYRSATHALLLMDDGGWQAGLTSKIMTEDALSHCLGHPIDVIWHGDQCLFFAK